MEKNYSPSKSCKKYNHYCDKAQYGELSFWQSIKLYFHLIACSPCRAYRKKNIHLTQVLQQSGIEKLTQQERERLKQQLREKI